MGVMEELMLKFSAYAEYDAIGDLIGISPSAPPEAANAYNEFTKMLAQANSRGLMI